MKHIHSGFFALMTLLIFPCLVQARSAAESVPVTVTMSATGEGPNLSPDFLGLSYESSMLLPGNGKYYFDSDDRALINTFQTLGIKNLRVGANAVDDPRVPVPGVRDIDVLFDFARAAGVKVIYSFRLKNGDPEVSARLANYIAAHDADVLDAFSIGNEPSFYFKTFPVYLAHWKPHYDAILKTVPNAMFDGPSVAEANYYAVDFAGALFAGGHLAMASDHYYFLGSGRAGEKDPAATRARFLQDSLHAKYAQDYAKVGAVLAAHGVPYRIDEMNSCYNGGAKDSSDTYASTLWALDCTHWWAAHHILGVNYHTGESVGRDGGFGAANYAAFVHRPDGNGFVMRPQAYALLAFTQAAHGRPLDINLDLQNAPDFNFDAYAWRDTNGSISVTLINKSYGDQAKPATVSLQGLAGVGKGKWQRMDLVQANQDIAAKTGVTLGGAPIDADGLWAGKWKKVKHAKSKKLAVQVAPASAAILRFVPAS
ncbi:MAG TPA: hypothetical protein VGV18_09425 [Verrucomicrobiae bacterium]|nr:hypothetical protein [Verrucomicrobiae bacterium]